MSHESRLFNAHILLLDLTIGVSNFVVKLLKHHTRP